MEPEADSGDCGCAKCCLPTIVAERDEARAVVAEIEESERSLIEMAARHLADAETLRARVAELEQVASCNPERLELLAAKYSGKPYSEERLEALQAAVRAAFNRDEDMLRAQLAEAKAALEGVSRQLGPGHWVTDIIDPLLAKLSNGGA